MDETAGDVAEVHTAEGVDCAGVSADLAVGGVREALLAGGDEDVGEGPGVVAGAAVPLGRRGEVRIRDLPT